MILRGLSLHVSIALLCMLLIAHCPKMIVNVSLVQSISFLGWHQRCENFKASHSTTKDFQAAYGLYVLCCRSMTVCWFLVHSSFEFGAILFNVHTEYRCTSTGSILKKQLVIDPRSLYLRGLCSLNFMAVTKDCQTTLWWNKGCYMLLIITIWTSAWMAACSTNHCSYQCI